MNCNVPKRGWMAGIGGCPNVGGICIGCTMPGFPDKFMPFMDEPPGAQASRPLQSGLYGKAIRALRGITNDTVNKEPKWRHPRPELTTGYQPKQPTNATPQRSLADEDDQRGNHYRNTRSSEQETASWWR